jgi:hypothetical protein
VGSLDWVSETHVTRELARVRYTSLVIIEIVRVNLKHQNQNVRFKNTLRCVDA